MSNGTQIMTGTPVFRDSSTRSESKTPCLGTHKIVSPNVAKSWTPPENRPAISLSAPEICMALSLV